MVVTDSLSVSASPTTARSTPLSHRGHSGLSYHIVWTGSSVTATLKVYASNKPVPDVTDEDDWVEQTDIAITGPTTSNAGSAAVTAGNCNFLWYKLVVTRSAGSGTFTVYGKLDQQ